jgi:serine/threonine protein kinase/WD40 repeat protein
LEQIRRARLSVGDSEKKDASPPTAEPLRIGRFEIIRELGRGGHGIVFLAFDPALGRAVALKVPRPEVLASAEMRRRFIREAHAAGRLKHPNIIDVHDVGDDGPVCYIAWDYCPGGTLASFLRARPKGTSPTLAALVMAEIADGVQYAHDHGVLHRDVKPSNILLANRPEGSSVNADRGGDPLDFTPVLTDFGLARVAETTGDQTKSGTLLGTPAYMAPEQAKGRLDEIGPATDVYGLGVVLYEMLAGRPPFRGATDTDTLRQVLFEEPPALRQIRPNIPADLEAICRCCLEHDQHRRYSSARELGADLRRFLRGEPTLTRPLSSMGQLVRWIRRKPTAASLIFVSIMAVVSLLVLSTLDNLRLSQALAESRDHERRAEERALIARQHSYVGSMSLLSRDARKMRLEEQLSLLEAYIPKVGEPDVRGFEWWLFWRRLRLDQPYRNIGIHKGGTTAAEFDSSGRFGATGGKDGVVRLWKMPEGAASGELNSGSNSPVNDIAFSPNGSHLAAATDDGAILLWNIDEPKTPRVLKGHTAWAASVAFSPDGKTLASGGDQRVLLWDFPNGKKRLELTGHTDTPRDLMFNRDGDLLISAGEDGTIRAWDVAAGAPSKILPDGIVGRFEDCWPRKLAFDRHGDTFVALFNRKEKPLYWKLQPKLEASARGAISLEGNPRSVSIFAKGKENRVAFGMENGGILIPEYPLDDIYTSDLFLGHRASVDALAATSDGRSLLSCDARGSVLLWDLTKKSSAKRVFSGPTRETAATIAPSGTFFVAKKRRNISVVDAASGKMRKNWPFNETKGFPFPAVAPNDDILAVCDSKSRLHFMSPADGKDIGVVTLRSQPAIVRFSPDGVRAVACAQNRTHIISVRPSAESRVLNETSSYGVAFLDSTRLLTPCMDGNLRLWNLESAEPLDVIPIGDRDLRGIALSPDRTMAAVGGFCAVFIVDLASRKVIATLPHNSDINELFFLSNGATLLTKDTTPSYRLWNTATWQEVGDLEYFGVDSTGISVSSDGYRILFSNWGTETILDATPFSE